MALLTAGIPPQPYGDGGRSVTLPVKAASQIYEGSLVAQSGGACVAGTSAGAGDAVGVAMHDQLGGATDGAKRISVECDRIFIFANGASAVLDSTPFGTTLFMEDDHTVGLGTLGATAGKAGTFMGIEDDGRVRCYISEAGSAGSLAAEDQQVTGTVANQAASTVQRLGRVTRYMVPALGQATAVTLGTTGAVKGDLMRLIRTDASVNTLAVVNGGAGAGTLCTLIVSKIGFAYAIFDGANWLYDGSSAT